MIPADPVLVAARTLIETAMTNTPVGIDETPDAPEAIVLEYGATTSRPGTLATIAEDLALHIIIRGIARGPGAARRARHLTEQAAAALIGTRPSGTGWETVGWRHVTDSPAINAGDLANTVTELELHVTPTSPAPPPAP